MTPRYRHYSDLQIQSFLRVSYLNFLIGQYFANQHYLEQNFHFVIEPNHQLSLNPTSLTSSHFKPERRDLPNYTYHPTFHLTKFSTLYRVEGFIF